MHDFFDPRTWPTDDPIYRIYGDPGATIFATVDWQDYEWAVQWMWTTKWSRGRRQRYLCRQVTKRTNGHRENSTLFLHVAVMLRTSVPRPSPLHTMVDHLDGDPFNCRRSNLRWATPSMNRRNTRRSRLA